MDEEPLVSTKWKQPAAEESDEEESEKEILASKKRKVEEEESDEEESDEEPQRPSLKRPKYHPEGPDTPNAYARHSARISETTKARPTSGISGLHKPNPSKTKGSEKKKPSLKSDPGRGSALGSPQVPFFESETDRIVSIEPLSYFPEF